MDSIYYIYWQFPSNDYNQKVKFTHLIGMYIFGGKQYKNIKQSFWQEI